MGAKEQLIDRVVSVILLSQSLELLDVRRAIGEDWIEHRRCIVVVPAQLDTALPKLRWTHANVSVIPLSYASAIEFFMMVSMA